MLKTHARHAYYNNYLIIKYSIVKITIKYIISSKLEVNYSKSNLQILQYHNSLNFERA